MQSVTWRWRRETSVGVARASLRRLVLTYNSQVVIVRRCGARRRSFGSFARRGGRSSREGDHHHFKHPTIRHHHRASSEEDLSIGVLKNIERLTGSSSPEATIAISCGSEARRSVVDRRGLGLLRAAPPVHRRAEPFSWLHKRLSKAGSRLTSWMGAAPPQPRVEPRGVPVAVRIRSSDGRSAALGPSGLGAHAGRTRTTGRVSQQQVAKLERPGPTRQSLRSEKWPTHSCSPRA